MKYFGHDTNAHSDSRLFSVLNRYGFQGYGLYWFCNEVIGEKLSVPDCMDCRMEYSPDALASIGKMDEKTVKEMLAFFVKVGLFTKEKGHFVNKKILAKLDRYNRDRLSKEGTAK